MTSSPPILDVDGRDTARLRWCVSVFGLLLGFATWPLWAPEGEYPLIPWFEVLRGVPTGVDRLLACGIVLSGIGVAVMTVREWVRPRPVERDRPDDQGLAGVHSPNGGISLSLPPLPHNRYGFRGAGASAGDVAPSPQPSPPQHVHCEGRVDRGGEGAGRIPPMGECTRLALTSAIWLVCLAGSVMLDQLRFQVWAWELFWFTLFLNLASPRIALRCCRVLVIGIYFYSAVSKLDAGFVQTQGPWLWQGMQRAWGFQAQAWGQASPTGMLLFPVGELLVAIALCFRRARLGGIAGSWVMHLGLLLALGPWGWDQRPGVLLWNGFFLVSVPLLFWPRPVMPERVAWRSLFPGERFCVAAVIGLSVWPALSVFGLCDHWPAWEVYSSRPEVVRIQIADEQVARLPPSLQKHVGPAEPLSPWRPISIDQWSFEQRHCPTYPQGRYRLAVARHLETNYGVDLRVTEQSTPDRWTGKRQSREIESLATECDRRFWFNTVARNNAPSQPVSFGDRLIALTAQFAVACYAIALLLAARQCRLSLRERTSFRGAKGDNTGGAKGDSLKPSLAVAGFWTAGLLGLTVHVACAFHFLHHWSHAAALKHTAQRTAEVTGWDWPGGLYINYVFLLFWAVDAVRVWREALGRTPVASRVWRRVVQGVFLFMMFNATVVFGPWHWTAASVVFASVWWMTRRMGGSLRVEL